MSGALGHWIDGERADVVPIADRGLHYGDGLFETVLVREGRPRFLDLHLRRLASGCDRLALPFPALAELRAEIAIASSQAPSLAILKIIVTRGNGLRRGYAPDGREIARRIVSLFEATPPDWPRDGVELHPVAITAADQPALAGIKHLNRLENVLASRAAREAHAFDALMSLSDGSVVSGAMSNLFLVTGNRLATPLLDRAGVAGVIRAVVMRESSRLGLDVSERRLTRADISSADEAFVTNARIGVVPVRRVGEHAFAMNTTGLRIAAHVETLDA